MDRDIEPAKRSSLHAQFVPVVEVFRGEKQGSRLLYTLVLNDTIELNSFSLRFSVADGYQNPSFSEALNFEEFIASWV